MVARDFGIVLWLMVLLGCGSSSGLRSAMTYSDVQVYLAGNGKTGRTLQAIGALDQSKEPTFQNGSIARNTNPSRLACTLKRIPSPSLGDDRIAEGTRFKLEFNGSGVNKSEHWIAFAVSFLGISAYPSHSLHCTSTNPSVLTGPEIIRAVANYLELP